MIFIGHKKNIIWIALRTFGNVVKLYIFFNLIKFFETNFVFSNADIFVTFCLQKNF